MVTRLARNAWDIRWSWVLSILLGAMLAPLALKWVETVVADYHAAYDIKHPIVDMRGLLVTADEESVMVHMAGTKSAERAQECSYVRVLAYTRDPDGIMRDAYIKRVDMPEDGHTKPAGNFDIGTWRVWPRGNAIAVLVFAVHDCGGRQVRTMIAEVAL